MTKRAFELPVQPFPVIFEVAARDIVHEIRTQYRETPEGGWIVDIFDADKNPKVMGIPLVVGLDLLYQYNHLNLGFALVVLCLHGRTTPTYESLGREDRLLMVMDVKEF